MKLEKFMCDVTKALVKEERVHFLHCENEVFISPNGYFGMIIPEKLNIFNHDIRGNFEIPTDWKDHEINWTMTSKYIGKKICRVFKNEIWDTLIDEKYLKYFDMHAAQFYQTSEFGAVFVRETTDVCGVIMPVQE